MSKQKWFGLVLVMAFGCGGPAFTDAAGQAAPCVPHQQESCGCDDGAVGWQTCQGDATWSDCTCAPSGPDARPPSTVEPDAGPPANPCATSCPKYQVCSDGTDGHLWGECWGCTPGLVNETTECGTNKIYYKCPTPDVAPHACTIDTRFGEGVYCCPA